MSLVQDDHMGQAFAADAANEPFHVGILPWTPGGDHDLLDPHVPRPQPKVSPVDPITVAQEIAWRFFPREGIHDLLGGPRGGGMLSDVEMYETSALMGQDEQDKQYCVAYRRHDKEIQS